MTAVPEQIRGTVVTVRRTGWRTLLNGKILFGVGILGLFLLLTVAQPLLSATVWADRPQVYDPRFGFDTGITHPSAPSLDHWLGTNSLGRDVFSMLIHATPPTLLIAVVAASSIAAVSLLAGSIAGYRRGWVDGFVSHLSDAMVLLPAMVAVFIVGIGRSNQEFGSLHVGLTFGILYGLGPATATVRAATMTVAAHPFIEAARVAGGGGGWIITRHVLPNVFGSRLSVDIRRDGQAETEDHLLIDGIERRAASRIYAMAQEEEQAWEEKRRVRTMEEILGTSEAVFQRRSVLTLIGGFAAAAREAVARETGPIGEEAAAELASFALADSIAIDPHKWLYAPLEAGCVLARDAHVLRDAFAYHPPYYHFGEEAMNYVDLGPQNSRGFRALKVWLALRQAGREGYERMIGDDIRLSRRLHERVAAHPDLDPVTQELSITTFRCGYRSVMRRTVSMPSCARRAATLRPAR